MKLIICMLHGSKEVKDYEQKIVTEIEEYFSDFSVIIHYYSRFYQNQNEHELTDIVEKYGSENIYVVNIILSSGFNYQVLSKRLAELNLRYTTPLLTDKIEQMQLDESVLYIAHGPDNTDYEEVKKKYNLIYLDEILSQQYDEYILGFDKIALLFLSRSKHVGEVMEYLATNEKLNSQVLLEEKAIRSLFIDKLKNLIFDEKV